MLGPRPAECQADQIRKQVSGRRPCPDIIAEPEIKTTTETPAPAAAQELMNEVSWLSPGTTTLRWNPAIFRKL